MDRGGASDGFIALTTTDSAGGIPIGTEVYDVAGEYIGKVSSADTINLVVTSGWLLLTDCEIRMSNVGQFENGKLSLKLTKVELLGER